LTNYTSRLNWTYFPHWQHSANTELISATGGENRTDKYSVDRGLNFSFKAPSGSKE